MPWAASQVAWAGPGVLDLLVVPASRRRREAGRHHGAAVPEGPSGGRVHHGPCVTVAETGHHRVRRRRRGTAGVMAAGSVAASTVTSTSNIHQRTERAGGCPNSGIAFTASIVSPDQASARRSRQAAKPISTAAYAH